MVRKHGTRIRVRTAQHRHETCVAAREEDERLVTRLVEERRRTLIHAQRAARKADEASPILTQDAVHVVADAVHVVADAATTAKRTTRKAAARRGVAAHEEALRMQEADRVAHLEALRALRRVGAAIGGH